MAVAQVESQRTSGRRGRGHLSLIDKMPAEANHIIAWANEALRNRDMTQREIYSDFVSQCEDLMRDYEGEIDFAIPSFSSFHRHSFQLAKVAREMDAAREMAAELSERFDATSNDEMVRMTAAMIQSLVFSITMDGEVNTKDLANLTLAMQRIEATQKVSDARAQTQAAQKAAIETAGRRRGLTEQTMEVMKSGVLGIELDNGDRDAAGG